MSLRDELYGTVPDERMEKVPGHFSLVGEVAVISIPTELEDQKKKIGEAIISDHKNVKTVFNKISKLEGERRVAGFEVLAGGETVTCHREFGFAYKLDVARVFFNPRLGRERMRVASKVSAGERAIVPFAGVGPFAISIAAVGARVLALEKSPEACRWHSLNARLNRVESNVEIVNCDAFAFVLCGVLKHKFDRAVVPTPYGRDEILDSITPIVKPGGTIHFYTFKKRHQIEGLIREFEEKGLEVEFHRRCGNVAPGVSRWVFDLVKF
jgi:tRNA (guanine37-N1)-methyltransferase